MSSYIPIISRGTIDSLDHDELRDAIKTHHCDHVKDDQGNVLKMRGGLNKKSVPLEPTGQSQQRLSLDKVDSYGVLEDPDRGADQPPAHTGRAHAVLSASSAHRWLNCTPSARIEAGIDDQESDAAAQGTAAHELAEHKLRQALGLDATRPTSDWQDQEMDELTDDYVAYVLDQLKQARKTTPDAEILIEQRLDFSHLVPDGFGTGDCVIIADTTATVIDFKYGAGVLVDAYDNPQMKLYALGALNIFDTIYDIDNVRMVIYQPRRDNISETTLLVEDLNTWADEVLAPAAKLADAGEGELNPGPWCGFCKIKITCRARAEANLALAQHEFADPNQLTDAEIADVLAKAPELVKWAKDIERYATDEAVQRGKQWPGFKVVEGRSIRKYGDDQAVAQAAESAGYTDIYEKKLLGITAMEKLMGKKEFSEVLGDLVVKPAGKPTLVPESDKRKPMAVASVDSDFGPAA